MSRKAHTCERGCKIEAGHRYFREAGSFVPTKICASCMAMILYYQKAWLFPVYQYDYWDEEKNAPHFVDDGEYAKIMQAALGVS